MSDENMASGDGAAESDPASSSDVEITGAEPANVAYDSDDETVDCTALPTTPRDSAKRD